MQSRRGEKETQFLLYMKKAGSVSQPKCMTIILYYSTLQWVVSFEINFHTRTNLLDHLDWSKNHGIIVNDWLLNTWIFVNMCYYFSSASSPLALCQLCKYVVSRITFQTLKLDWVYSTRLEARNIKEKIIENPFSSDRPPLGAWFIFTPCVEPGPKKSGYVSRVVHAVKRHLAR